MSLDPRLALDSLTSALAEHLNAVAARRSDDDPRVDEAYERVAEAFTEYEDALWDAYSESTPLDLFDDDTDDDDLGDEDEDESQDGDTQEP